MNDLFLVSGFWFLVGLIGQPETGPGTWDDKCIV